MIKKYILVSLLLSLVLVSNAQNSISVPQNPPPPPPKAIGCEEAKSTYRCTVEKLQEAVFEFLKPEDIEQIINSTQKDTIFINTKLSFNADKKIVTEESYMHFHERETKLLDIKTSTPIENIEFSIVSASEEYNTKIARYFFLKIDRENKKLIPLYDYKPKRRPFSGPDKFAIYPGCESAESLREQKKCFTDAVNKLIGENFNTQLASDLDLEGLQRMFGRFTINEEGAIVDIKVRAPHPALGREVERVIKLIPALQPASLEGVSIAIPYVQPIVFRVQ